MPKGIDYGRMKSILLESRDNDSRQAYLDGFLGAIEAGEFKVSDFDFHRLFESSVEGGREILDSWKPGFKGEVHNLNRLIESGATDSATFANISGQIVYTEIMRKFNAEEFVFSKLIPTISTPFNGEKMAGISSLGDKAEVVEERGLYPLVGPGEDWVRTPETKKRGLRTALTREAIYFNRVEGRLVEECSSVGTSLALNKEKRAIDCLIDENTTVHRYNRRDRGAIATYGDNSGTHDFDNLQASNALVDWTDIDNVKLLLSAMRDPNTGEPIDLGLSRYILICAKGLESTAKRILNATEVTTHVGGYATSGNLSSYRGPNPVGGDYEILCTNLFGDRLGTDTSWFYGDPAQAFAYMENFPLSVEQAPPNSQDEFNQDIVMQWKASERGTYVTREPRFMAKSTA